jgi:hypothetical protein
MVEVLTWWKEESGLGVTENETSTSRIVKLMAKLMAVRIWFTGG